MSLPLLHSKACCAPPPQSSKDAPSLCLGDAQQPDSKMVTIDNGMIKKACLHNLHVNEVPPCGADQPALQHLTTKSGQKKKT